MCYLEAEQISFSSNFASVCWWTIRSYTKTLKLLNQNKKVKAFLIYGRNLKKKECLWMSMWEYYGHVKKKNQMYRVTNTHTKSLKLTGKIKEQVKLNQLLMTLITLSMKSKMNLT